MGRVAARGSGRGRVHEGLQTTPLWGSSTSGNKHYGNAEVRMIEISTEIGELEVTYLIFIDDLFDSV